MNEKDNSSNGLLKIVVDSFREDINEMESVMTVMIINDPKLQFNDEYSLLERGEEVQKGSERYILSSSRENGVIKMRTKLTNSEVSPEQMRHPIILAKGSRLAELIMMDSHVNQLRSGPEQTKKNG